MNIIACVFAFPSTQNQVLSKSKPSSIIFYEN
jgi:hypothetical protein